MITHSKIASVVATLANEIVQREHGEEVANLLVSCCEKADVMLAGLPPDDIETLYEMSQRGETLYDAIMRLHKEAISDT